MAKPLPDDMAHVAQNARRAEIRSVAVMAFIVGGAVGFGLGRGFPSADGSHYTFFFGVLVVAALWFLAARRRAQK
ncbi:hypothetical protein [Kordiimonas marina]|uniref:hypothetical protein n=1 Tax=Kordiimonas marina TaxID=2872312 RepID=UPI001FF40F72|nr:hypothetical protein [Kordiimonas marina]MCJ9429260.1 hypothetical protein [Kordiimonas marina]